MLMLFFPLHYNYLYVAQLLLFSRFAQSSVPPQFFFYLFLGFCLPSSVPPPGLVQPTDISDRGYEKVIAHWWAHVSLSCCPLWDQAVHTGSLTPQAQSGFPAGGIHNVRHLHIPSNNQINLGPCAGLWLATVAYQSGSDFAQENNKSWRLHLLPWITAIAFPHSPYWERFTRKGRRAHSLWKSLHPKSKSSQLKLCLFTLPSQLIFGWAYGLRVEEVQHLGRLD